MVHINEKIVKNIKSYGISSRNLGTSILVLDCLDKGKYEILDVMDDENKEKEMLSLYRDLQRKGLIDYIDEGTVNYHITKEGKGLIDYIQQEIDTIPEDEKAIVERLGEIAEGEVEDWINEYIEIFPEGVHEGKKLRDSTKRVSERMRNFLTDYPHSKEIILQATRDYIHTEGITQYTRNCYYFIYKKDKEKGWISDLLTYCEEVKRRNGKPKQTNFDTI